MTKKGVNEKKGEDAKGKDDRHTLGPSMVDFRLAVAYDMGLVGATESLLEPMAIPELLFLCL